MEVSQGRVIDGYTQLCVLLGNPVGHSMSPAMHNSAFAHLGLNYLYFAARVEADQLTNAIKGLRGLNVTGANVTIPYKEAVVPLLDQLSPQAKAMGAVNTIVNKDGQLIGHNTDGIGFVHSLQDKGFEARAKKIVLIGTGGAAKGVALALADEQPKDITIIYRSPQAAEKTAAAISNEYSIPVQLLELGDEKRIHQALGESHLLVHTTPVGMYPHTEAEPLVKLREEHSHLVVADLIYNPLETRLLADARSFGCLTLSGLGMFVNQGALAFQLWTGHQAPKQVMEDKVIQLLK